MQTPPNGNGRGPGTSTDPSLKGWVVGDHVSGLRIWGTNVEHDFPEPFLGRAVESISIGKEAGTEPWIRLDHESVSRRHATIEWRGPHMVVIDQGSKNGTRGGADPTTGLRGDRQAIFQLVPGAVVSFGSVDTVAFSPRMQKIRAGYRRLLGYGAAAQADIERVQHGAMHRHHLALVGPTGGVGAAVARLVHETTPTSTWPFVVPDELPGGDRAQQRALAARAAYGTLVLDASHRAVRVEKLPRLFDLIADNAFHLRLVLLAEPGTNLEHIVGERVRSLLDVISVPPLESRRHELQLLLSDTVAYHCARAGAASEVLRPEDLVLIEALAAGKGRRRGVDHIELEEVVERLVFIRKHNSASEAERALGLKSRGALSKWAGKYGVSLPAPGRPRGR